MSEISSSSSSCIENVPAIEKNTESLVHMHKVLIQDNECNLVFSTKEDQRRLDQFVDETIFYAGDLDNHSSAHVRDFFCVFLMYVLRVDDKLLYESVQRRKAEFAQALAEFLDTKEFSKEVITLCSTIYENNHPDGAHGSSWGEHFLDEHHLSNIISEIADNKNNFWHAGAVTEAKLLFPD